MIAREGRGALMSCVAGGARVLFVLDKILGLQVHMHRTHDGWVVVQSLLLCGKGKGLTASIQKDCRQPSDVDCHAAMLFDVPQAIVHPSSRCDHLIVAQI